MPSGWGSAASTTCGAGRPTRRCASSTRCCRCWPPAMRRPRAWPPSPRSGPLGGDPTDHVDDPGRAQDGQDEAAGPVEEQVADEAAEERPAEPHQDGHEAAHGLAAGDGQAAEGTDDEPGHGQADEVADHLTTLPRPWSPRDL